MNRTDSSLVGEASAFRCRGGCARLGVSPFIVRAWRRKGQGPRFMKLGRAVRYRSGRMVHLVSRTEPRVQPATPRRFKADGIADPDCGDTIGCIHWDWMRPNGASRSDRE